jgi:hypothetical protein
MKRAGKLSCLISFPILVQKKTKGGDNIDSGDENSTSPTEFA